MPPPPRRALRTAAMLACLCAASAGAQPAVRPPAPAASAPTPIRALLQDADRDGVPDRVGSVALVAGRVTAGTGLVRSDAAEVYVQDGTGGLRLRLDPSAPAVLTGDSVWVRGALAAASGMAEMEAPEVRVVAAPPRQVEPAVLPVVPRPGGGRGPDLEGHEGEWVEVEGRVVQADSTAASRRLVLLSGTDLVTVVAATSRASPATFGGIGVGDYVRARGIAVQHGPAPPLTGTYGVLPLTEGDVRRAGVSPAVYRNGALAVGALFLIALVWAVRLRRQVRSRSEALRSSEARYGYLVDAVADPVLVIDAGHGGRILEANRAAQRAFGVLASGDWPGRRPATLSELAADAEEAAAHLREADSRETAVIVLDLYRPDGQTVPFEVATRRVREGSAFVAVARDVEERRAYEHGLLTAIGAAEEAREKAEEAARLKSAILANMSHEVRTPLTAILGFADILREEVDEDLVGFADTIWTGGKRLLDTLNDVIDFAQLDAERASLEAEPIDVVTVVRGAMAQLAPLAQRKGLAFRLQSETASVHAVHAVPALSRVVTHLVGNAIKFTDHGEVLVSLTAGPDAFGIRVQDTGVGIAEEFLPHLFEAFTQESEGHSRSHEGTGLGLAVTHRLLGLMGGEIRVESRKGEGSRFDVTLPLQAPEPDLGAPHAGPPSGDGHANPVVFLGEFQPA